MLNYLAFWGASVALNLTCNAQQFLSERPNAACCRGDGFDLELVEAVSSAVTIPVIASSGAGSPEHFQEVFEATGAAAALAAGIFHRREVSIEDVKTHMSASGIPTRTA